MAFYDLRPLISGQEVNQYMLTFFKRWSWQKTLSAALIALMALCVFFLLWSYSQGKFDSVESMQAYVSSFGAFAPVVLTVVQAGQVVVPILPGFLGCAVGAALFGPAGGFVCNYIGISAGSIIAYFLARKYGVSIVKSLFKEKTYQKWEAWIGRQKYFPLALFMAILLPLFPDDFFCYFSGLTTMKPRRFIWIILIGKPWCILAYSLIFGGIL